MVKVIVDGVEVEVQAGSTAIQACEEAGVNIPRFCYHEELSVAGNCRMCLVEVEKSPKLQASCAFPVMDGVVIHTASPRVLKAREGVMEFLLANHPLDCPVCDQGGECDLQDQAMRYGSDRTRFLEGKRSVTNKNLGTYVKSEMNRCIHCTRCVRFSHEVAGDKVLGTLGRGQAMEIGTYTDSQLRESMSGNVADLCPVGALTHKKGAFQDRVWELEAKEGVRVADTGVHSVVELQRGGKTMRVLPREDGQPGSAWLSDSARDLSASAGE